MKQWMRRRKLPPGADLIGMLVLINVGLLGLPLLVYAYLLQWGWSLWPLQLGISSIYLIASMVLVAEASIVLWALRTAARGQRRGRLQQLLGLPTRSLRVLKPGDKTAAATVPTRVSIVVVAYLPNEEAIILETLEHILTQVRRPLAGLEVVLAYNTPHALPVEASLQQLAGRYPELILLRVEGSTSKAENLNAALPLITGEMTCIFDADHHPAADCLERGWAWLREGRYDLVQGRNIIRNHHDNWLTQIIAVEFECLYGVSHYGRSLLVDTALFGGSNGYWRTSVLRRIGFQRHRLTEDIDATLRSLLRGYRIVHDPDLITSELAPVDLLALWAQRCRWSQGWLEVALAYEQRLSRSRQLDITQKAYWLMMLFYSKSFYLLTLQVLPITLSLSQAGVSPSAPLFVYMLGTTLLTIIGGFYQVYAAVRVGNPLGAYPISYFLLYCLASPIYFWFKGLVAVVALAQHLIGKRQWHVTRRIALKPKVRLLDAA